MGNKVGAVARVLNISDCNEAQQEKLEKMHVDFHAHLPRTLVLGDKITLIGKIADNAEIFSLNLVCEHEVGTSPRNVAYHHKMIFNENKTVLNAKSNGEWHEEELEMEDTIASPAYVPGDSFQLEILIQKDEIYFYNDGNLHSTFKHRISIEDVKYIQIWEGVECVNSMLVDFVCG